MELLEPASVEQPYQEVQPGAEQQPYGEAEAGGYEAQSGAEEMQSASVEQPYQEVQPGAEQQPYGEAEAGGYEAQPPEQGVQPGAEDQQESQGTEPSADDVQPGTDERPEQEVQPGGEAQQPGLVAQPGGAEQQSVQEVQLGTEGQPNDDVTQVPQPGGEARGVQPDAEGQQESQGTEPGAYEAEPPVYGAPPYEEFRTVKLNEVDGVSVFQIVEGDDGSQPGVEGAQPGTDEQPELEMQPGGEAQQQPGLLVQPGDGGEQPVQVQASSEPALAAPHAQDRQADAGPNVVAIQNTGPSEARFDLVFLGDGYTASEQDLQRRNAEQHWKGIEESEPWNKYRDWTNVWLVPVVSRESGVDNDPAPGINRDTALDMGFFCDGRTERLLCANDAKAKSFASQAPEADAIVAMANSTKYGGAGARGVATVSGGNAQSTPVLEHELGHSVAGLADEYSTRPDTYSGGEPTEPNVTKDPTGSKWASYLGRPTPDGGVIGVYEGGDQFEHGIYRPSQDSKMRTSTKPFNLVSLDAMDRAIRSKIIFPAAPGADTGGGGTAQ